MKVSIIGDEKVPNGYFATQSRSGSCIVPVPYPSGEEQEVLALPLLLDAFIQGAQIDEIQDLAKRARKGSLHFMASVFSNLTSVSDPELSGLLCSMLSIFSVAGWA